jgi:hypothetical protein
VIRLDDDLGVEPSEGGRERHDVHDGGTGVEDPLRGHQDGRVEEADLTSFRCTQVEVDDLT